MNKNLLPLGKELPVKQDTFRFGCEGALGLVVHQGSNDASTNLLSLTAFRQVKWKNLKLGAIGRRSGDTRLVPRPPDVALDHSSASSLLTQQKHPLSQAGV